MVHNETIVSFDETRMSLESLSGDSQPGSNEVAYSYGILTWYGNSVAFIKPAYFHNSYSKKVEYCPAEIVIFDSHKATMIGSEDKINTNNCIYLVRYVDGGLTVNPQTGEHQPTINYSAPVEVLMACSKKQCLCLSIEDGYAIVRKTTSSNSVTSQETADNTDAYIDSDMIDKICIALNVDIAKQGFVYASSFPRIVEECCKTKFSGKIEAFIKKYLSASFRYEATYILNGKKIPGVILPCGHREILIPYSEVENGDALIDGQYVYGIIDYCTKSIGFINIGYEDQKLASDLEANAGKSVFFTPAQVIIHPQGRYLNTKDNIYLVRYARKGTAINTKTGQMHPALDYSIPITILQEYPKSMCSALSIQEGGILYREEWDAKTSFQRSINNMAYDMDATVKENRYLQASEFPKVAEKAGILNFRKYADSVEAFINEYLPKFEVKKNVVVGGTRYPGIIILRGSWPIFEEDTTNVPHNDSDNSLSGLRELDLLFEEDNYIGYLRSPQLANINFCNLPRRYQEMTLTCAARILFQDNTKTIVLDLLQKELIDVGSGTTFYKKWTSGSSVYSAEIMESCARTSWSSFLLPENNRDITSLLNDVGKNSAHNDNYKGLCTRFSLCYDALTPCLFLIRIATAISDKQRIESIKEYCQVVKNLQQFKRQSSWNNAKKLFGLSNLIAGLFAIFPDTKIPSNLITNIASTYLDCDCFDDFVDALCFMDPHQCSDASRLWQLYRDPESWTSNDITKLLNEINSIQLFQKTIALLWERFCDERVLPDYFLNILSWVLVADSYNSADEFLRYHFVGNFNKRHKQIQLIASLDRICELLSLNFEAYALATYITHVVAEDAGEKVFTSDYDYLIPIVQTYGENLYFELIQKLQQLSFENRNDVCPLIRVFRFDFEHGTKFQTAYTAWFLSTDVPLLFSTEERMNELCTLFDTGLYDTYIALYAKYETDSFDTNTGEINFEKFIHAHLHLHRFSEAIKYLESATCSVSLKKSLIIHSLAENFRVNTLSPKAFEVFTDTFPVDTATSILLEQIQDKSNNEVITHNLLIPAVNSLLSIYCHQEDFCKSIYLYKIFQTRAENGYTRLFSRIRSVLPNVAFGKSKNFYDVIELSFYILTVEDLIQFIKWAKLIIVPEYKEISRTHTFSFYYEKILSDPTNASYWNEFLIHMTKRFSLNLWTIVVCEAVIKHLTGNCAMPNSLIAIDRILDMEEAKRIPYNLLPYAFAYIIEKQESELCIKLINKLSSPDVAARLFASNPWNATYSGIYSAFKAFALDRLNQTGEKCYLDLISVIPGESEIEDLKTLAQNSGSIQLAIPRLCKNYLANIHIHESIDFINHIDRKQLSYRDCQLMDLLSMLFDEDEYLLEQHPQLFSSELYVRRVKSDCASILSKYPGKEGVIEFERTCINPTHKMIVYSFVFRVLYDEDIYHFPAYQIGSLDLNDSNTFYAYAFFMKTILLSQLYWNAAFPHFYKVWRYLKLYITTVLINMSDHVDDSFIVDAMVQYDHYETVFHTEYAPFQDDVNTFIRTVSLPMRIKQYLLAALMSGDVAWFLERYSDQIRFLRSNDKVVIQRIASRLDYREAAHAVYTRYSNRIRNKDVEEAIAIGSAFSEHIVAALSAFKETELAKPRDADRLWEIALANPAGLCFRNIMTVKPEFFTRYSSVLIPVLFSRQFAFHLYRYFRDSILKERKSASLMSQTLDRFERCAAYYEKSGNTKVKKVFLYLSSFRYCLLGMRKEAQEILISAEIEDGIPVQWLSEAKSIQNYAFGISEEFHPATIDDASKTGSITDIEYTFVQMLQKKLGVPQQHLSHEAATGIVEAYQNTERPLSERMKDGIALLTNYPDVQKLSESIPSKEILTLEVGLNALKSENIISTDEQLIIAVELFNGNNGRISDTDKKLAEMFRELLDAYKMILNRHFSLSSWVQHGESIRRYLTAIREASDFVDILKHVLQPCQTLLAPDCSNEKRYVEYHALLENLKHFQSIFAGKIDSAIRRELDPIESGVRLRILLDRNDGPTVISTDGYIYYQIENIGVKTALLNHVSILFQQEGMRSQTIKPAEQCGITELQCGFMTGGRLRISSNTAAEAIQVSLRLMDENTKQVISDTTETVIPSNRSEFFTLNEDHKYSCTGKNEFLDPEMLFGREEQTRTIMKRLDRGIATIYGPSRIGKSSLLNWVEGNASRKGKILTVLFGGEGGLGKGKDYSESFAKKDFPEIPYSDNYQMSEYLLTQTIIHALTDMTDRLNHDDPRELFSADQLNQIIGILRDTSLSIVQRYSQVNKILQKAQVEIWLMLDEFQDVVEKWCGITSSCDFVEVCNRLLNPRNKIKQIKLILCGSDDLLRHMAIKDKSVWRETLWDSRVPVGPLDEIPFSRMMRMDNGISGSNIVYSDAALHSLFTYTGGVALYGKEIGNVIISNIRNSANDYQNRNIIYVSDVAAATQQLLTQQNRELASEIKEGIREIYDAVTKNLGFETDKQYLWYIAKWLHENPDHDKFPESKFTGRELVRGDAVLRDSLTIAVERKILKCVETVVGGDKLYSFCTIFYYNAFLGTFDGNLHEDLIFASESAPLDEFIQNDETPAETIRRLWPDLDEYEQSYALGGMATSAKSSAAREALKQLSGNSYQGDDRRVTINVQSIANTLNGILVSGGKPEDVLSSLQSLPRLSAYLGDSKPLLLEKLDSDDPRLIVEAEAKLEESTTKMVADYLAALVSRDETPENFCAWTQLGISKTHYDNLSKAIAPSFMAELILAAKLDYIFDLAEGGQECSALLPDYSPVSIMYCKILEKMLKFYHTRIYSTRLGNASTEVKLAGKKIKFGDLLHMGETDRLRIQNQILLGAFLYPINPEYDRDWSCIANNQTYQISMWKNHGRMLLSVKDIRNESAHGAEGVSVDKGKLMKLKDLLFSSDGLVNIIALCE